MYIAIATTCVRLKLFTLTLYVILYVHTYVGTYQNLQPLFINLTHLYLDASIISIHSYVVSHVCTYVTKPYVHSISTKTLLV